MRIKKAGISGLLMLFTCPAAQYLSMRLLQQCFFDQIQIFIAPDV